MGPWSRLEAPERVELEAKRMDVVDRGLYIVLNVFLLGDYDFIEEADISLFILDHPYFIQLQYI